MKNLVNKNCLITGASHGIGRSLSMLLAKEGANLYITDIDMDNLQKTKDEIEGIGAKVISSKCDISKVEDFEKLAEDFSKQLGDVDILINNAGIAGGAFLEDLEFEEWKKILDINLWGIIHSLKVFLPKMLKRGSGHIINTGSGAGIVGLPFHPHYVASKFAVVGITEALYSEFSHRGLKFSVICPTRVKTNIINTSDIKIPRDMITSKDDKEYEDKYKEFKRIFWEKYSELGGLTPTRQQKVI
jgi:short-subunit dehydrogenase